MSRPPLVCGLNLATPPRCTSNSILRHALNVLRHTNAKNIITPTSPHLSPGTNLKESHIRQLFDPKLENPILVEGLPGFGNIGRIVARSLIEYSEAKLFAEYYSPSFPDYVNVNKDGICSPPHYRFYAPTTEEKPSTIILTGNAQPSMDDVVAHYKTCEEILDFVQKLGCNFVVTVGGVPVSTQRKDVYVVATSNELAAEIMEKGGIIYGKGRILGATGLLLGLAKERGMNGFCLLGATAGLRSDKDAGLAVFQLLLKVFRKELQQEPQRTKEKG